MIANQNKMSLYYTIVLGSLINFILAGQIYFETNSYVELIEAGYTFLLMVVIYGILIHRAPKLSRYLFPIWFSGIVCFNLLSKFNTNLRVFQQEEKALILTTYYLIVMNFLSYCEFKLSILLYTPLYIIACYFAMVQDNNTRENGYYH